MSDTAASTSPWEPPRWQPLSGRLAAEQRGDDGLPRLVFVHGFTQTRNSWKPIAEQFVATGHQCVVVDLPGHGESGHVRADLRRTADMIATLGGRATYIGYSLGGRAALHVALMYPNLVKALVTIGANPGIDGDEERARRRESDDDLAASLQEEGVDAFLREWSAQPLFGGLTLSEAEMTDRLRNTVEGLSNSLRMAGTGAQGSLWPRLRELNMPVLAMAGAADAKFAAIAEQIARTVPRGRCVLIPGAAHAAHLQQPQAVVDAITDLL
jgi:2-succinyl-6-hydroxy-2,4-cyclohexadiene-1-carboxylate synthase